MNERWDQPVMKRSASASCLYIRRVRTDKRSQVSVPLPRTRAAVLARRCHARTNRVYTFLCFLRGRDFSPDFRSRAAIQALMLVTRKKYFCTERNRSRYWLHTRSARWQSVDFLTGVAASLRMAVTEFMHSAGRERLGSPGFR